MARSLLDDFFDTVRHRFLPITIVHPVRLIPVAMAGDGEGLACGTERLLFIALFASQAACPAAMFAFERSIHGRKMSAFVAQSKSLVI
jgi:hypothetical protein